MTYDPLSYGEIKLEKKSQKPGETPDDILFEDAGPGYAGGEASASEWSEMDGDFDAAGPTGSAQELTQFGSDVLGETGRADGGVPASAMGATDLGGMDLGAGAGELEADDYAPPSPLGAMDAGLDLDSGAVDVGMLDTGIDEAMSSSTGGAYDPSAIAGMEATAPPPAPAAMSTRRPAARRQPTAAAVSAREASAPARKSGRGQSAPPTRRSRRKPRSSFVGTLLPTLIVAGGGSAAAWFYMMEQNVVMAGIVGVTALVGAAFSRLLFK